MTRRGFTLLEVVVALAILAVSLVAILDINAQSVASHIYARRLTVATLLARSKMVDLEQTLHDKGMNVDDEEDSGDFSEEGWPSYQWRAKIVAPKTNGLTPEQLFAALLNLPVGSGKDGPGGLLSGLFGAAGKGGTASASPSSSSSSSSSSSPNDKSNAMAGMMSALGPMAGIASQQFSQMVDQLQKAVREVHLTVTWKEGRTTESFDLVTHVVSLGPGSDRNGGAMAAAGLANGSATYVRKDGTPARQPTPCASGAGMCDSDGSPLWTAAQFQAGAAGLGGPAGQSLPVPGLLNGLLPRTTP
jgi:general secretion pathway protein I